MTLTSSLVIAYDEEADSTAVEIRIARIGIVATVLLDGEARNVASRKICRTSLGSHEYAGRNARIPARDVHTGYSETYGCYSP